MIARALGVVLALAAIAPAADAVVVERVSLVPGTNVDVRIQLSAPATVMGQALGAIAGLPDRILVDIDGSVLGTSARGVVGGRGVLVRIIPERRDQGGVRLVMELLEPASFVIETEGRTATVRITDVTEATPIPPKVPPVAQPAVPGS